MRKEARGVTLMELLITIAVAGILLGIGVPSFQRVHNQVRANNALHLLTTSLAGARIAAVTRQQPVSVCASRDGITCRDDAIWDEGWIVYKDVPGSTQPATLEAVVHRVQGIGATLTMRSTAGRNRVRFQPNGRAYGANASIRLCSTGDHRHVGSVIVNNAGRSRIDRPERGSCPFKQ